MPVSDLITAQRGFEENLTERSMLKGATVLRLTLPVKLPVPGMAPRLLNIPCPMEKRQAG